MRRRKEFNILNCSNTVLTAILFYSLLIDAKDLPIAVVTEMISTDITKDHSNMSMTMPNESVSTSTVMIPTSIPPMTTTLPTSPQYRTAPPMDSTSQQLITKPNYAAMVATLLPPNVTSMHNIRQFDNINTNSMSSGHDNNSSRNSSNSSSNISFNVRFTTMKPLIVPTLPDFSRHRLGNKYNSKYHHDRHFGPFFEDPTNSSSGTLQVGFHQGTEAILNCRVGMLKDKTVMWVRRTIDKVSLLTVGNVTYSGDPRIKVMFIYPNNWRLTINPISPDDAGLYMCQVSTHPPRVFATNLTVLAPAVRLVDEMQHEITDRYYKLGSSVDITCQVAISYLNTLPPMLSSSSSSSSLSHNDIIVSQYPTTTTTTTTVFPFIDTNLIRRTYEQYIPYNGNHIIKWKKDGRDLPKDIKINLSTTHTWRNSRISIIHAEKIHSGSYSCFVDNSTSSAVNIQILMGETPAAVQHNLCSRTSVDVILLGFLLTLYAVTSTLHHISRES